LIGVTYLWDQSNRATNRDNRDEIITITSILIGFQLQIIIIFNKSIIWKNSFIKLFFNTFRATKNGAR